MGSAAAAAFKACHQAVRVATPTAGCTLTVVFFNPGRHEVTCMNAGDSLALIATPNLEMLTADHRISNCDEERARIIGLGGKIARAQNQSGEPAGPMRAWPGGLAVARGIGDLDCDPLVSCEVSARPPFTPVAIPTSRACAAHAVPRTFPGCRPSVLFDRRALPSFGDAAAAHGRRDAATRWHCRGGL